MKTMSQLAKALDRKINNELDRSDRRSEYIANLSLTPLHKRVDYKGRKEAVEGGTLYSRVNSLLTASKPNIFT